jgi:hypothetical protein
MIALWSASRNGRKEVVKVLLRHEVYICIKISSLYGSCQTAAGSWCEMFVNRADKFGKSPLFRTNAGIPIS